MLDSVHRTLGAMRMRAREHSWQANRRVAQTVRVQLTCAPCKTQCLAGHFSTGKPSAWLMQPAHCSNLPSHW